MSSDVYIVNSPDTGSSAILRGELNKKLANVELAPGPPLSQTVYEASASVLAGYIQKKSWCSGPVGSGFELIVPAYEQGHSALVPVKPGNYGT